ncbi:MAG: hypothetical protein Q7J98_07800 [Kiritimatiellia bacterium]|nr:hypothetical protein [Kiritimatiellia bacterium]
MSNFFIVILMVCCVGGCCPGPDTKEHKEPAAKSVVRETIDGFTGKTAVDNLKRAKPKIDAANKAGEQKRQDIDELTKP